MTRKLIRVAMTLLIISTRSSFAIPNAVSLSKGESAPFTGVLLSDSYSKEVYRELNEVNKYKLLTKSLQESVLVYEKNEIIYKQEITQLTDQNVNLAMAVQEAKTNSFWTKALWFSVGFVLSGATVYMIERH